MSGRKKSGCNASNTMLCYSDNSDQVALVPWPDYSGLSDPFDKTTLACRGSIQAAPFEQRKALVFITAMQAIVRDGVDPMALHKALLGLDEYRDGCAADVPGMKPYLTADADVVFDGLL